MDEFKLAVLEFIKHLAQINKKEDSHQCYRTDLKARERSRNRDVVLRSIILAALLRRSLA